MDEDFPMLEYLYIEPLNMHDARLSLPESLQAQGLRHLVLFNFAFPIGSLLLKDLVTLSLENIFTSTQTNCSNDFHSCPNSRHSGLALTHLFPTEMLKDNC